jgi:hypothetical protein
MRAHVWNLPECKTDPWLATHSTLVLGQASVQTYFIPAQHTPACGVESEASFLSAHAEWYSGKLTMNSNSFLELNKALRSRSKLF